MALNGGSGRRSDAGRKGGGMAVNRRDSRDGVVLAALEACLRDERWVGMPVGGEAMEKEGEGEDAPCRCPGVRTLGTGCPVMTDLHCIRVLYNVTAVSRTPNTCQV